MQLNSYEFIFVFLGWKIIQHGWSVKFAFRYSISQFSQIMVHCEWHSRSLHRFQE